MFGRVRSSPSSSLDCPEMLPSSKILKLDSLSIYEATLMRLKVGSQLELTSPTEQAEEIPNSVPTDSLRSSQLLVTSPDDRDAMTIDTCLSASNGLTSGSCQSTSELKESGSRNGSIAHLFSKYKSSQNALRSSYEQAATMVDDDSAATSSSSSNCLLLGRTTHGQTEHETFSSSVCQM